MQKWILWGLIMLLALTGIWYFLLKSYDYSINFQTSAAPGTIYLRTLNWKKDSLKTTKKIPYDKIFQNFDIDEHTLNLKWQFTAVNDSVTLIQTHIKSINNSFMERLRLLFYKTETQKRMEQEMITFRGFLEKDKDLFDISIIGKATVPETPCACISLESTLEKKAKEMMESINLLNDYFRIYEVEMAGKPRVRVTYWNRTTNRIKFDFCFPLIKKTNLPNTPFIKITKIPSQKALKAIYHGNYIFSHHAWLQLLSHAKLNNIEVSGPPIEIFIDNPQMGGNSRNWEAEIYLPVE